MTIMATDCNRLSKYVLLKEEYDDVINSRHVKCDKN